jgi:membrane protein YqaA with SNARE-associated domain
MHHFLDILKQLGPVGVLVLAMVESAGIPNPGGTDVLLLFMAAARPEEAALSAALAVIGSLVGSMFFFELMRRGGEKFLTRHTASGRGQRFRAWFMRYGMITVFVPAILPIPILPFKAFCACAGAMGVTRKRFLLVLAAARIPRYAALAYLGSTLGEHSGTWLRAHGWYLLALGVALAAALGLVVRRASREALQLD